MALSQEYNFAHWDDFLAAQALKAKLTPTQTRVFLTRFAQSNWLKKIEDIWQLSDVNSFESFVKHSTNIYKILSLIVLNLVRVRETFRFYEIGYYKNLHFKPAGNSYILSDRHIETECYQTILQPGALIRIKAPSKMGKTPLLNNILAYAVIKTIELFILIYCK